MAIQTGDNMTDYTIRVLLSGNIAVGNRVTIKGWVRTRRDSKAGISFITVHDGSCFDAIQAVVPSSITNYANEIMQFRNEVLEIHRSTFYEKTLCLPYNAY